MNLQIRFPKFSTHLSYLKKRQKLFLTKFHNFFCSLHASDDSVLEEFCNVRTYLANDFTIYCHSVKLILQRVFCPITKCFKLTLLFFFS